MGGLAGVLTLVILGLFTLSAVDTYLLRTSSLASVISAVLVDLTNGDRTSDRLGNLTISPTLTLAAQAKADDMAAHSYFAHTSPDGKNSWYWFNQAGYTFLYAGENLAVDFSDSVDVEHAWMNSPTHRENILNEHFSQIGIATAEGTFEGHPTTFVVQMFGTPAPVTARPQAVVTLASPVTATEPALATTNTSATKPVIKPTPKPVVKPITPKPTATTSQLAVVATTSATTSTPGVASSTSAASTTPVVAIAAATPSQVLGSAADSILPSSAGWWQHLLASPKTLLATAYGVLALIILILLAHVTELEFHKRHTHHFAAVVLLFVLMAGLFVLADFVFFTQPVLAAIR
ncbi:MAG: hypothetical protein JWN18_324 [Parcubacteria group bacterium]|nr:hypothetical protein [Parcubacteria group bacterium]